MKRMLFGLVMAVAILSLVGTSWAGMVMGDLVKIDTQGSFYFVKDKDAKEHKIHFDKTTKVTGEVKVGAKVEVDEDAKGHAVSIKVMEMMKK